MLKTKFIKLYATVENEGKEEQEALYFPLSLILEYLDTDDLTEFMEEYTTDDTNELEALAHLRGYNPRIKEPISRWYSVRSLQAFKKLVKELDGRATIKSGENLTPEKVEELYKRNKRSTLVGLFMVNSGTYFVIDKLTQEIRDGQNYTVFTPQNKIDNDFHVM